MFMARKKLEQRELAILRLIYCGANYSRLDIARKTGLSPALITGIVRKLIGRNLVIEAPAVSLSVGRKPIPLEVRPDVGYFIGLDIGSYYSHIVVTDVPGQIVYKERVETEIAEGRVRVLQRAFECVRRAIADSAAARRRILGLGIAHSGVIDSGKGVVLSFPRPGQIAEWKDVPLRAIFEKEFRLPCLVVDSVRAKATAEGHLGLGRGLDNFLFVEVGMGIGAALFFEGKLYRGGGGKAGEFGHITVAENGPLCSCGNNGCLESVASCAAIIEAGRLAIERGAGSRIRDLASGDLNRISIEVIAQAAAENDSLALRVLQEASSYIGRGLADLVNLLNPRLIIFGGAFFRAAPQFLTDSLGRIIRQRSIEKLANDVQLHVSPLGVEAGALGASRITADRALTGLYLQTAHPDETPVM
jgi:predicted NBD/HSP70 family sugar kinase